MHMCEAMILLYTDLRSRNHQIVHKSLGDGRSIWVELKREQFPREEQT